MNDLNKYDDNKLIDFFRKDRKMTGRVIETLWERYSNKLYQYCKFKSTCLYEAEEIHQKAWIRFYNYLTSGREIKSIQAFLYKTAYLISLENFRKNNKDRLLNFDTDNIDIFEDPENLMQYIENNELINKINIAVNMLDDSYKDIFILRWLGQLPFEEIAQIMNETVDCVKKRSYRSMEKIIKILKPIINELARG